MPKKGNSESSATLILNTLEIMINKEKTGVRELSRELCVSPSTALRYLQELVNNDFLEHDKSNAAYTPGLRLLQLSTQVNRGFTLPQIARPVLEKLFATLNESINLGILTNDMREVMHMDKIAADRMIRIDTSVGKKAPAYCTALGKAMWAFNPIEDVIKALKNSDLIPLTPTTKTEIPDILQELELIRKQGYAVDKEEYSEHLECIAAPIFNNKGKVVAALSVSVLVVQKKDSNSKLIPIVLDAAQKISSQL
ncbi:IclR family transcriptional regulator [Paenibacillus baekrokdamisoli]|uniref:IclR family transcriptional regulator n=1 Tax=Paenibacillus baekrokdamisoli TaxID=1712516 RepID=A0A3G9IN18_9BACL|nr:IclR family transcriptional regulator [Paenibacillus baekrokdamisoli]MBB3073446.1 DNA-binding IclR family transcriptional regulator [Paenibacillus baekrokdamisoli]BBH20240.1 IclR family transcriptional regulator [Paenibacillus baekrokdamisoli]